VHMLPLRNRLTRGDRFSDHVTASRTTMLDAYDHQDVTFGRVLQLLPIARDPSRLPLITVVFNIDQALSGEAAVAFFNLLGVGLLVSVLVRGAERRMLLIGLVAGAALVAKAISSAALNKAGAPLAWFTPGVTIGLLGGWVMLYGVTRLPRAGQLALGALCIVLATVAINLAPDNPYQSVSVRLIAGGQSHFLNFSGIVRALSDLWPLLAVGFFLYGLAARRRL